MRLARLFATLALAMIGSAFAQDYPSRPVKLIVPWPAGQNTDLAARMLSERLGPVLGQPVVIDNRPGAGGLIGTEAATKAHADGYTLLAASSGPISVSPNVQKVPFDADRDLAPVTLIMTNPFVLVANPSLGVNSAAELIQLLRANPGKYAFASSGSGATGHLMTVLFNSMARVEAIHVPYKGAAPALTDVVSGQVAYAIESIAATAPLIKAGRLKALGVTSATRSSSLPDVPTIAEAARLPGYDVPGWVGIMAPAGTSRELRQRLAGEIRNVMDTPELRQRMVELGMEPATSSPDEFGDFLRKQHVKYGEIARASNLKID